MGSIGLVPYVMLFFLTAFGEGSEYNLRDRRKGMLRGIRVLARAIMHEELLEDCSGCQRSRLWACRTWIWRSKRC